MQCPNCGAENNPKDRFCSLCGEVLKTEQADYTDENRAASGIRRCPGCSCCS